MELLFLLTIFPAIMVGRFFVVYDPGPPEPRKALEKAVFFGVLSVLLALLVSSLFSFAFLGSIEQLVPSLSLNFLLPIFVYASVEEFVKFVPLSFYVYKKGYFNERTDGIIYFAFVGLTFGAIESFLYALGGGEFGFIVAILRLVMAFFFHAALTSFVGYFLAKAKVDRKGFMPVFFALIFACLVHTIYNIGAFSTEVYPAFIFLSAGVAITMNVIMFWLYYRASEDDIASGFSRQMPEEPQVVQAVQYSEVNITSQQVSVGSDSTTVNDNLK